MGASTPPAEAAKPTIRLQTPDNVPPSPPPQEHVGEYGAHWNFFTTVVVVALLAAALDVPPRLLAPAALAATATHQAALTWGGQAGGRAGGWGQGAG